MKGTAALVTVILISLHLIPFGSGPIKADSSTICKWRDHAVGACTLTFDDGTRGRWECAVPVLNSRGFRGTFYVIGSFVEAWWDASGPLHLCELPDMAREGHEIGSHTYARPDPCTLTDAQIGQESPGTRVGPVLR
jgi:peptidoglycan/xylan/chitin deacetylase (PgdA/CDA1 family)